MIHIKSHNEFDPIRKELQKYLNQSYNILTTHTINKISGIRNYKNTDFNMLIVELTFDAKLETNQDIVCEYIGVMMTDILRLAKEYNSSYVQNEYVDKLFDTKKDYTKLALTHFTILGYFTHYNSLHITMPKNTNLPDDITQAIVLFPTYDFIINKNLVDWTCYLVGNTSYVPDNSSLINTLITPLINFCTSYHKNQAISQLIPENGIVYFDDPMNLPEILKYYHPESPICGILNKLIKDNNKQDVLFSNLNCFSNQKDLNIEYFGNVYLDSWDIKNDFHLLSSMVNEAYMLKRKSKNKAWKLNKTHDRENISRNHKKKII